MMDVKIKCDKTDCRYNLRNECFCNYIQISEEGNCKTYDWTLPDSLDKGDKSDD